MEIVARESWHFGWPGIERQARDDLSEYSPTL